MLFRSILINDTWKRQFGTDLTDLPEYSPTGHYVRRLQTKKEEDAEDAGAGPSARGSRARAAPEAPSASVSAETEPSWAKRLFRKMRKSFCLKANIEDRLYEAHVRAKEDRVRQKAMMRHFQLPVSDDSDPEVTPEEEWKAGVQWSSDEDAEGDREPRTPVHPPTSGDWAPWD